MVAIELPFGNKKSNKKAAACAAAFNSKTSGF
jgi:hypothetical protein